MIQAKILEEMVERIATRFHAEKIILFGSQASGEATDDSDVDVLVVAETALPPQERSPAVRRLLADYPVALDIIVKTPDEYRRWRSVVNHLVYFANKYGKTVYER